MDIIAHNDPDVASLQEITADTAEWIQRDQRIRERYLITDPSAVTRSGSYGLMTLVRKSLQAHSSVRATWQSFLPETRFGRGLLMVALPEWDLAFGNLHLESPPKGLPERRAFQLHVSCKLLADTARNFVVMGDFNYVCDDESIHIHQCGGVDCWSALRPAEPGYTKDGARNVNRQGARAANNPSQQQMGRPDRIVCAAAGDMSPLSIELVGVDLIEDIGIQPSDHFGLVATVGMLFM